MANFVSVKLIFATIVLLAVFLYWVFNFVTLYHLARFGIGTQPKKMAAVFLLGSITLFSISVLLFASLDINSLKNRFEKLSSSLINIKYQK